MPIIPTKPDAETAPAAPIGVKPADPAPATPTAPVVVKPAVPAPAPAAVGGEPVKGDHPVTRAGGGYRNQIIFALSALGIVAGLVAAYLFGVERKAQPPAFTPVSNPYDTAIYANGIIESDQPSGSNINLYPEVSGPVSRVLGHEGQTVTAGTPLVLIDYSVQKATTEQLVRQAAAALALLNELKAQPRPEVLVIAEAQRALAESGLKIARDQYEKDRASFDLDPKSISKDALDTAHDTADQAAAALDVARRQYELVKAGAWSYDVASQERQYEALQQASLAAAALLAKYTVRAQVDGVVLALNTTVGSSVSSQGAYNAYTQGFDPVVVMSAPQDYLAVRCYIDEILVSRLPTAWHIRAQMSIRGSDTKVPLEFVRIQPYVSPKIELSNQRQEKVDLRVLPVVFRFPKQDASVYPGQLVDVFIGLK